MANPTYPGVYIEEVPSGVRTITGVATSITAFIGRALRGPLDEPVRIHSFAEFERTFGGLWRESTLSYAVRQFFENGGSDALIVRVFNPDEDTVADLTATYRLPTDAGNPENDPLMLVAASPGAWGDRLEIHVDHATRDAADTSLFNLTVREVDDDGDVVREEVFRNVSIATDSPRLVSTVLEQESHLVAVQDPDALPTVRPLENAIAADADPAVRTQDGGAGIAISAEQITGAGLEDNREGLWALEHADLFNLLCIPPLTFESDVDGATWSTALGYCETRRAMLLVDPPDGWSDPAAVEAGVDDTTDMPARHRNAAVYWPRLLAADPLQENRLVEFAPCGAVAGICARTDSARGVWKAPAGQEARLRGVAGLSYRMTDPENGQLNPLGVNCLRTFPVTGHVVWGARTMDGADRLASEWKYLPVRRLALFLEESLYRGTQWVIFEPNDEPLWAQIRLNVGAFMHNLFRQGAFQGTTPKDAYFVKCDREPTTQNAINQGVVNLLVGFAPLKPAEFLIIKISQLTGEIQT